MAKQNTVTRKKEQPKIRTTEVTENLKCMLTEAELKQAGEEMAKLFQDKAQLEKDKASAMASFKAKIDAAEASLVDNANQVRDKYVYRDVDCVKTMNFTDHTIKVTRSDTKATYINRTMTVAEKHEERLFDSKAT